MKLLRALPLVVCLSLGMAAAQEQKAQEQKPKQTRAEATATPEQQEILQASDKLRQAMLNPDSEQLRQILAFNYTGVDMMGRRLDRTDAVEVIAFGPLRFSKIDIETQSIQVGDGGAVQTGSAYVEGNYGGQLFNSSYRFVRQWQRQDGQWKLVMTHIQGLGGTL